MISPIVQSELFRYGSPEDPVRLLCGESLPGVQLAYETYGELNAARDNAVLVFHALSGSQHAAGWNPDCPAAGRYWQEECYTGWWDGFIGPGKAIDTHTFFVICANYLGGCYGSTGPSSLNPETGKPYGGDFPQLTVSDIADSQVHLLDHLGIDQLHAVFGASFGGMLTTSFATRYPERVRHVLPIGTALQVSILQQIHNFEQICAIELDPLFNEGHYYDGPPPDEGLSLARIIAHKTYVSLQMMAHRANDEIIQPSKGLSHYQFTHSVESYLFHHGQKFVHRFDANTYLRIVDAWRRYDLVKEAGVNDLADLLQHCKHQSYTIFSIDSDVCFYPEEQEQMAATLQAHGIRCQRFTSHTPNGHDAFLLEPALFAPHFNYVLKGGL